MTTDEAWESVTSALITTQRENTALKARVDQLQARCAEYEQKLTEYTVAFSQLEDLMAQTTYVLTGQGYAATEVQR